MIDPEDAPFLLAKLEQLCQSLGVCVRYERLGDDEELPSAQSGLCRLRQDQLLLVDVRFSPADRCRVLAGELRRFDLGAVFLHPAVRRILDSDDVDTAW